MTVVNRIRLTAPANRLSFAVRIAALAGLFAALLALPAWWLSLRGLPTPPPARPPQIAAGAAAESVRVRGDWNVLFAGDAPAVPVSARLQDRFRLLGTFFVYPDREEDAEPTVRAAIVLESGAPRERVVREGESLGDVRVAQVFRERIVLQQGGEQAEIWNTFGERAGAAPTGSPVAVEAGEIAAVGGLQIGRKVSERQWELEREGLMEYYRGLLREPARLLAVFDTLRPEYDAEERITGYVRATVGEGDFFEAVGVREGDIVRSVNEVPMTNRRRAEFFIRQFAENSLNAFIIEVEREGKREKLIYRIR